MPIETQLESRPVRDPANSPESPTVGISGWPTYRLRASPPSTAPSCDITLSQNTAKWRVQEVCRSEFVFEGHQQHWFFRVDWDQIRFSNWRTAIVELAT